MSSGGVSSLALLSDRGACILRASFSDGCVEVDPSGHSTSHYPSHQKTHVEDVPPGLGHLAFEGKVEERGEDEGKDGGSQASNQSQAQLKARYSDRYTP